VFTLTSSVAVAAAAAVWAVPASPRRAVDTSATALSSANGRQLTRSSARRRARVPSKCPDSAMPALPGAASCLKSVRIRRALRVLDDALLDLPARRKRSRSMGSATKGSLKRGCRYSRPRELLRRDAYSVAESALPVLLAAAEAALLRAEVAHDVGRRRVHDVLGFVEERGDVVTLGLRFGDVVALLE